MEKEKVLNLLDRFDEILAERKAKKSNIHIALEITVRPDGRCKHYVFILDEESGKKTIVNIKGFERIVIGKEIKTFDDILEELGIEENE
ncbi:hypothetical protein [Veillonella denticariosi]|uniref:hypothetical protein n=1 Tax=Veillonella denticariosi TaxID=419208 RepID=UPI00248FBAE4|nr:hypothetical protein [Veillonella denticariosi]